MSSRPLWSSARWSTHHANGQQVTLPTQWDALSMPDRCIRWLSADGTTWHLHSLSLLSCPRAVVLSGQTLCSEWHGWVWAGFQKESLVCISTASVVIRTISPVIWLITHAHTMLMATICHLWETDNISLNISHLWETDNISLNISHLRLH